MQRMDELGLLVWSKVYYGEQKHLNGQKDAAGQ